MRKNLDIALEFAQKIKDKKGILQIVLFGSVARGEDTPTSDIDIAIVYEGRDKDELLKNLYKVKPERIQLTPLNITQLSKETEMVGALSGEGLLLHGEPIKIKAEELDLKAKIILSYSLTRLEQKEKAKVNRALYGSQSEYKYKGKKYTSKSKGLVSEHGIEKINRGVLLMDRKKSFKIKQLFHRFGVEYQEIPVWSY